MGYYASWGATDQIPQRAVDAGLIDRSGAVDSTDGGSSQRFSLSGEWRQSEGNVSRYANLYAVRSRLDLFRTLPTCLDNPENGDQFKQAETRTLFGGSANQTWLTAGRPAREQHRRGAAAARPPEPGGPLCHPGATDPVHDA